MLFGKLKSGLGQFETDFPGRAEANWELHRSWGFDRDLSFGSCKLDFFEYPQPLCLGRSLN